MLAGIDPIIIFQFAKLANTGYSNQLAKIPVISEIPSLIEMPPIPIYLSASLTGLYIDSESKNLDINTETETLTNGENPNVNQKGIANTVTINLFGKKDSIGLSLLSAMMDQLFDKVTSKEYSITYLHGAVTIFRGVLHSFSVDQSAQNDLLNIKIELSKGEKTPQKISTTPTVEKITGALPIS